MKRLAVAIALFLVQLPVSAEAFQATSNPFRERSQQNAAKQLELIGRSSQTTRVEVNPFRANSHPANPKVHGMEFRSPGGHLNVGGFAGRIFDDLPVIRSQPHTNSVLGNGQQTRYETHQNAQPWQSLKGLGQGKRSEFYSSTPRSQTAPTQASSNAPSYQQPIAQADSSKRHQGVDYDANAGIGFDQRTDKWVGGRYDSEDGGIIGGGGSVGAGIYGDAGVSQSGKIGNVEVRNYAEGEGFVGTEAGAKAGLTKNGVELGANGFAGGRASGTVGSEIGAVEYGATGEAWSGVGLEAGVNGGFKDGKLKFGAEAGGALGVGGKLGFQAEVDVERIGNGVKKAGKNVGNAAKTVGRNVGNTAKKVGKDVGNTAKKVTNNVGKTAKKAGKGIGDTAKKIGGGTKKFFNKFKKKKKK